MYIIFVLFHVILFSCCIYVTGPHLVGGTGTLDRLADSHTMLAIYPTHAICYQRVVIHASLDTRF